MHKGRRSLGFLVLISYVNMNSRVCVKLHFIERNVNSFGKLDDDNDIADENGNDYDNNKDNSCFVVQNRCSIVENVVL